MNKSRKKNQVKGGWVHMLKKDFANIEMKMN